MSDPQTQRAAEVHPQRKEIARYLLSRGLDPITAEAAPERILVDLGPGHTIEFPAGLAPTAAPIDPAPAEDDPLPVADVVVITWTVDEVAGLAHVLTPTVSPDRWHRYSRGFDQYRPRIRPHAPAANSARLGSYMPTRVGAIPVLCMKSELHLNQDGVKTGDGTATLPVSTGRWYGTCPIPPSTVTSRPRSTPSTSRPPGRSVTTPPTANGPAP
jgi:hypothetical protein